MPHLDVPQATLYYETSGHITAPAVLLLHAGIATLRMWDPLVAALEGERFVIRADARGFGQTSAEQVPYSERQDARDLLDHLGVEQAIVVGSSRGGGIALDLALETPERVAGVVTICSAISGSTPTEPSPAEAEFDENVKQLIAHKDWHAVVRYQTEVLAFGANRAPESLEPGFVAAALSVNRTNAARVAERPRPLPLVPPASGRLDEIAVPVLATVGDDDLPRFLRQQHEIVTRVPSAEGYVFADSAHLPSLEHPEEFAHVLSGWLARHDL